MAPGTPSPGCAGYSPDSPPREAGFAGTPGAGESPLSPPSPSASQAQAGLCDLQDRGHFRLLSRRELASQPFLRPPPRLVRGLLTDLLCPLGHVGQHCYPVRQHLQEAAAHEQLCLLVAVSDQQWAWLQRRQKRRVPRQDAELAVTAAADQEGPAPTVHVSIEE